MKVAVVSDTHGLGLDKVIEKLRKEEVDKLLFLGDCQKDAWYLEDKLKIPVFSVLGNNDYELKGEIQEELFMNIEGKRIFAVHGHSYGVDYDKNRLLYRAKEKEADIALFGHTHSFYMAKIDGILLINPGSPSIPRDGSSGSFVEIVVEEDISVKKINMK